MRRIVLLISTACLFAVVAQTQAQHEPTAARHGYSKLDALRTLWQMSGSTPTYGTPQAAPFFGNGPDPTITTFAGGGPINIPASAANMTPSSVFGANGAGLVLVADPNRNVILEANIAVSGIPVSVIVGTGAPTFSGDGGQATLASLNGPTLAAGVGQGALLGKIVIVDTFNNRVRLLDPVTGKISTIVGSGPAGHGTGGFGGDGGPATSALLNAPQGAAGNQNFNANLFFFADTGNNRIRKVDASTGIITTIAGNGTAGLTGNGGPAVNAELNAPAGVDEDGVGDLLIADTGNNVIREINGGTGVITTVAGGGTGCIGQTDALGDGCPAAQAILNAPLAVRRISGTSSAGFFIADTGNNLIRKVDPNTGIITTIVGGGTGICPTATDALGDGCLAGQAVLHAPQFEDNGGANSDIVVSDTGDFLVRLVNHTTNIITAVAGNGTPGFSGDGGAATRASIFVPQDVATDNAGNVFVADTSNERIREINAGTGVITTVAGNGTPGFSGDNGPATSASLDGPIAIRVDGVGNLYISDINNAVVRFVNAGTGKISTIAGTPGVACTPATLPCGDGGPATSATLTAPIAAQIDSQGNLYICDVGPGSNTPTGGAGTIRRVDHASGIITTVAGNAGVNGGFSGDNGPATNALFDNPEDLTIDAADNVLVADSFNNRVRRIDVKTGIISTIAGSGAVGPANGGFGGDNGLATSALLSLPTGLRTDSSGNLFIADAGNDRIRRVDGVSGIISTVAGNGIFDSTGDGGSSTSASLAAPVDVAIDASGNVFSADAASGRIRKVAALAAPAGSPAAGFSPNSLNFGNQNVGTTSSALNISVTSSGTAALVVTNVQITGQFAEADNCANGVPISPTANCTIHVTFSPTSNGSLNGSVTVSTNASAPFVIGLSGTGTTPAALLSANNLTFPNQNIGSTSAAQLVNITDAGTGVLIVNSVGTTGDFAQTNNCISSSPIPASGACTINVTFSPTATGTRNGTLTIVDNTANSPHVVALTGTGVAAVAIAPAPGTNSTATVAPGGTAVFPLILTSQGFTGTVNLSCSSPQSTITCAVIPSSVNMSPSSPTQTAISVQTFCAWDGPLGGIPANRPGGPWMWLATLLGVAALLLALAAKRERRLGFALAMLSLMSLAGAGCGSLAKGPAGRTPPGTYPLTITISGQGFTQSISLTVDVT